MVIPSSIPREELKDQVYDQHSFGVEIDGIVAALFNEVSGLDAKMEVEEYKEGGQNGHTWKFPGRVSFSPVTLKWGTQFSSALWDWFVEVVENDKKKPKYHTVHIIQFDETNTEVHRWTLLDAFPTKWTGPSFNAANSQIAVESMEITFSNLTFTKS